MRGGSLQLQRRPEHFAEPLHDREADTFARGQRGRARTRGGSEHIAGFRLRRLVRRIPRGSPRMVRYFGGMLERMPQRTG